MKKYWLLMALVLFLIPSFCFAQTNAVISFVVTVDNSKPVNDYLNSSTKIVYNLDEEILFSSHWTDTYEGLDTYKFETNMTGSFENDTSASFTDGWANVTKIFTNPDYEGESVYYRFHAIDVNNNANVSNYGTVYFESRNPEYYAVSQNTSTPIAGEQVNISSKWTDNFNVYKTVLETNCTGAWTEYEIQYYNTINAWSEHYLNTTDCTNVFVLWRITGYDNATNTNTTSEYSFTII